MRSFYANRKAENKKQENLFSLRKSRANFPASIKRTDCLIVCSLTFNSNVEFDVSQWELQLFKKFICFYCSQ